MIVPVSDRQHTSSCGRSDIGIVARDLDLILPRLRLRDVVGRLQPHPCLGRRTEGLGQTHGHIARDSSATVHNVRPRLAADAQNLRPDVHFNARPRTFAPTLRPSGSRQDMRTTLPGCGGFFIGIAVLSPSVVSVVVELGEHCFHPVVQIGTDEASVPALVQTLEPAMSEAPYHAAECNVSIDTCPSGARRRVARDLCRRTATEVTEHYTQAAVCARVPGAVLCLLTALRVHDIGTQLPATVWIAIPHKSRRPGPACRMERDPVSGASGAFTFPVTRSHPPASWPLGLIERPQEDYQFHLPDL